MNDTPISRIYTSPLPETKIPLPFTQIIFNQHFSAMKTNEQLQKDVQDAIKWEPLLHAAEIGVIAKEGIVTLTGVVDSYIKKTEAEEAAKNVLGVKAVVEKIEVKFSNDRPEKRDDEIANEVIHAIEWNWQIPKDKIQIRVENGWITLEGELQWNYQKLSASDSVKNLPGVRGVSNNIEIMSETESVIEKRDIENALRRNGSLNELAIIVEVTGTRVILSGKVDSLYQKAEAERMVWNAPGVKSVVNNLAVNYVHSIL